MNTQIVVKFQVEGLHAWPGVTNHEEYKNKVGFLQFPHRHQFHFKAVKSVSHDDRDTEIIDFKRILMHYLFESYGRSPMQFEGEDLGYKSHCDFGSMSCEMLAKELVQKFDLDNCEVLEDGENGALVSKWFVKDEEEEMQDKDQLEFDLGLSPKRDDRLAKGENITFVCGPLCSGKSTWAMAFVKGLNNRSDEVIETSNIVTQLLANTPASREDLQGHPELDDQIIRYIDMRHQQGTEFNTVVSGVRQMSILQAFPKATCVWIDADEGIRYKRYQRSSKDLDKSLSGFSKANERDADLGLDEVRKYIFTRNLK